ncbi:MAG: glycosyltransferase [Candidatus Liptonbacteria bacterium]|nr:glycosyltransferase [Candidatus Liptonbacteria bacterium]
MKILFKKIYKYFFKTFLLPFANRRYVGSPAVFESVVSADTLKLFVFVIAFNDAQLIDLQNRALKKYLRDPYEYFVIDNSSRDDRSEKIKAYCLANKISYARLPKNPGMDGSLSNGFALNWTYANLVRRFKPRVFGFIDHDLMPAENISIEGHLASGDSWGVISYHRTLRWFWQTRFSWWAGCAFFRLAHFGSKEPNFLPGWGIDTGGRVALNPKVVLRLPEIYGHPVKPTIEIAPGVGVYQCGKFIHFAGASDELEKLARQKRWMERLLSGKVFSR